MMLRQMVGARALRMVEETGTLAVRGARFLRALTSLRVDGRETIRQWDRLLRDALPLMAVSASVVGGIVAMQGLGYIERYAASEVFGWAAGRSSFREVGPLLLGTALAARTGARNTAEIAMMAARERLDAIRALGLDPDRCLVFPRLLATILVAVVLYFPACALVFLVATLFASGMGDQRIWTSLWSFSTYVGFAPVLQGFARMALFGAVVGLASCHAGVSVERSADRSAGAIGRAVYAGSVLALAGVMVSNAVLSVMGGT